MEEIYVHLPPGIYAFVLSASKLALGMSWKSGIMAEVIGTPKPSIGREMYAAKSYLQTADLFAWTVVVVILSVIFEKAFMFLLKKLSARWDGWFPERIRMMNEINGQYCKMRNGREKNVCTDQKPL